MCEVQRERVNIVIKIIPQSEVREGGGEVFYKEIESITNIKGEERGREVVN
jgi:hypothetical protein